MIWVPSVRPYARGVHLQRVNEFVFYDLAVKVHFLAEIEVAELRFDDVVWQWQAARDEMDSIFHQRPLQFSAVNAYRLYQLINEFIPTDFSDLLAKLNTPDKGGSIAFWNVSQIKQAAVDFETNLRTECMMMDAYYVVKKGTYSTKDLIENAHHQVPEPTRGSLPSITKSDFDQAGKCFVFDLPTAAAFHLLRGTEEVIRNYYLLVVPGNKQAPPKMRNWGTYIRLLRTHGASVTITSLLDHLKDVYRNPVLHPEEVYSDERVQVLFGLCVSAVVLIQSETVKLKVANGLPSPIGSVAP